MTADTPEPSPDSHDEQTWTCTHCGGENSTVYVGCPLDGYRRDDS
ncbi:hypothetical protein [Streptomyces sp. GSL17-111]